MNYLFRHANNYRVYGILKKIFSQKSFSKNGMTLRNPKKNLRKEGWQRFKWYNQMAQMAQVDTSATSGTGRSGSPELRRTNGTRTRGLRIPWDKWNKDKGSVQLNLSTRPNVELQGRENFQIFQFRNSKVFRRGPF